MASNFERKYGKYAIKNLSVYFDCGLYHRVYVTDNKPGNIGISGI